MDAAPDEADLTRGKLDAHAERTLLEHRSRFLAFLQRKTKSRQLAEDVLRSAHVRALERGAPSAGQEGIVAWFHSVLRNAWIDRMRQKAVAARAAQQLEDERQEALVEPELRDAICACVEDALEGLRPEYVALIREVDLGGRTVAEAARSSNITPNSAGVRLYRGRQALGRQLGKLCGACAVPGCLDLQGLVKGPSPRTGEAGLPPRAGDGDRVAWQALCRSRAQRAAVR